MKLMFLEKTNFENFEIHIFLGSIFKNLFCMVEQPVNNKGVQAFSFF